MPPRLKLTLLAVALPAAAAVLLWGMWGLPHFGHYPGPYGAAINHLTVSEQHITDAVTAVNFDYRGVDTIGEEFILFAAVLSVAVLLRRIRDEDQPRRVAEAQRRLRSASDAVRVLALGAVGPTLVLGIYVIAHGQITPGGGFQGGMILASGLLLVYLGGEYAAFRRLARPAFLEAAEAVGAGGFVAIGLSSLALGAHFLQNLLPLGTVGTIDSAGMVPIISALVGLEVGAGIVLVLAEFLEQTVMLGRRGRR